MTTANEKNLDHSRPRNEKLPGIIKPRNGAKPKTKTAAAPKPASAAAPKVN